MVIPNGVKADTIDNVEFEAGLILTKKFAGTFNKSDVLCATTGGIKVNIAQMKQVIKFDGLMDNTAGIERVVGWTASIQFSTKEVDAEKVKMALGYAQSSGGKIELKQGVIPTTEYKDLFVLGKMGDGSWRQLCIDKAINVNGLQETRNDKGETVIAFDLQAHYGIDTQDQAPVSIEYIAQV